MGIWKMPQTSGWGLMPEIFQESVLADAGDGLVI
jgi:hypothetical protein